MADAWVRHEIVVRVQQETGEYLIRIAKARGEPLGWVVGDVLDRYVSGQLVEWIAVVGTDVADLFKGDAAEG